MRKLPVGVAVFPDEENERMVNMVCMGKVDVNMAIRFMLSDDSLSERYGLLMKACVRKMSV